ncbi:MAG: hypothetical protein WD673_06750 [Alphaproteobacteria bacterium]
MNHAVAAEPSKRSALLSPRSMAIAAVAAAGLAIQVGWLLILAQGAVVAGRWLLGIG